MRSRVVTRLFRWAVLPLLVLAGLWRLSNARSVQLFGRLVSRVPTAERAVALTLDDGPNPRHTREVLDILGAKGVKATFFLIGRDIVAAPMLAAEIAAAGHELGNHSFTHPVLLMMTPTTIQQEVEQTDSALRAVGYTRPITVRPPFGKKLFLLPWYLSRTGRTTVTWDVEPDSYPEVAADPSLIVEHVAQRVRPGSIILMHVMYDSRATSRAALGPLIDRLQGMGYRFVTVSELMALDDRRQ